MNKEDLSILIVEDNLSFALELEMMVNEIGYDLIGRADNSGDALDLIFSKSPDLILMDIDIKGKMTGTEIGERIRHTNIPIIFITSFANENHFEQAQRSNIMGYLIKPTNKFSLQASIETAMSKILAQTPKNKEPEVVRYETDESPTTDTIIKDKSIFLKKKKVFHKVPLSDIHYIASDGNYCNFYLKEKKYNARHSISYLESILPTEYFLRIHRKHIVNTENIENINLEDLMINLKNGMSIPFSRNNKNKLLSLMKLG